MADYGGEHQGAGRRYPDVCAAAASGDLDGCCCCKSAWETSEYLGVSTRISNAILDRLRLLLFEQGVGTGDDLSIEKILSESAVDLSGLTLVMPEVGEECLVIEVGGVFAFGLVFVVNHKPLDHFVVIDDFVLIFRIAIFFALGVLLSRAGQRLRERAKRPCRRFLQMECIVLVSDILFTFLHCDDFL